MKPTLMFSAVAFALAAIVPTVRAQDVFAEGDLLRKALIDKDTAFLRSLDDGGNLVTEEGLGYLFDPAVAARIAPGMRAVRDIVTAAAPTPLVERTQLPDGQAVFTLYWSIPAAGGVVTLGAGQWMRTVAACAITQAPDGTWAFHRHLCFDETEGPFSAGAE